MIMLIENDVVIEDDIDNNWYEMMNVVFEVDCSKVEADGVLHGCKGVLDFIVLSLNVKSAYLII